MATKAYYPRTEIGPNKVGFSKTRSIIEAAFYGNNVVKVNTLKEAYELAKNSPGTVVTDMPVYRGEEFGLEPDAKVLLFNDGSITGRYAPARRITGKPGVNTTELDKILMDAVYDSRWKTMYHAEVFIGLDPEFMVKAHLLIPEGEENLLYSWMLNFQYMSDNYVKMYKSSKLYDNEPDIYIFSDPQWVGTDKTDISDPNCLCYFNTDTNCAGILGMRYFGEHKKGTLTLAWALANRNGYASCHGGQKEYTLEDGSKYVAAVFGLSGSGKSTLTHAKHNNKYPSIKVLHDDAFIINAETCSSVALEPTYFDKTADYPTACEDNKFLLTAQNCSATLDEEGKVVLVTEDIRNGNGRAIKSKLWSPNRVDKILVNDYEKFKALVENKNVDCYIINTGEFMGKKVQPKDTLGVLEAIVEKKADFKPWGPFSDIEIFEWEGFVPNLSDKEYIEQLKARMQDRLNYVTNLDEAEGGFNKLPEDAAAAIKKVVDEANTL